MTQPTEAYTALEHIFARWIDVRSALEILGWDQRTMMPRGAAGGRAHQVATLQGLAHGLLTDPCVGDLLNDAEAGSDGLDPWQAANLHAMRRHHIHATAVPADLVEAESHAVSACEPRWRDARADNDYAAVVPFLDDVLAVKRRVAAAKSAALGVSPYDALLDEFDPGRRADQFEPIFERLSDALPPLLMRIRDHQASQPQPLPPDGLFPVDRQEALGRRVVEQIGLDFANSRLDTTLHPFCGGPPDDVRITTRYDESDFSSALMGVMHETGHGLYEQNLPAAWRRQPVGQSHGMTLHESQSLIVEMQAGRSRWFLGWLVPYARNAFGGSGSAWALDNMIRVYHMVKPGFIRVDADEVTYPAHVILRTRLERAMLSGDLSLTDLPGAWNDGMRDLLGIVPPDDRLGCLQDIHWFDGAWGYFPTYTLGAIAAAQLFAAARQARPEIPDALSAGDFAPLTDWLRSNIHSKASSASSHDILMQATGRGLDESAFLLHLENRYLNEA